MTSGFIGESEIAEYLPHRGKMLLLSRVTGYDTEKRTISCEYDITEKCPFYETEAGGIPSWAGFELMAQSVCAFSGIIRRLKGNKVVPGTILSVSDFKAAAEWLKSGTTVRMEMTETDRDEESSLCTYTGALFASKEAAEPAVTVKISVLEIESPEKLKKTKERYVP